MRRILFLSAAALVAAAATAGSLAAARAPERTAGHHFTARVDNAWFPLLPGSVWRYRGVKDGRPTTEVMRVTNRVIVIDGAPCVVVSDRLYSQGRLAERTRDYYTQDERGTVWYFGEDTAELDAKGKVVSTEGTWRAGRDGARPGIFMPRHPHAGQSFRQEYYKGHAEDHFRVLALHATVSVPFVTSRHALLTKEWTPLEPGVVDHKLYVRGLGTVLEQTVEGGDERNELVSFTKGR